MRNKNPKSLQLVQAQSLCVCCVCVCVCACVCVYVCACLCGVGMFVWRGRVCMAWACLCGVGVFVCAKIGVWQVTIQVRSACSRAMKSVAFPY